MKLFAWDSGSVAKPDCTTCYVSFDHLGSVRLVTDQNANVVARHDDLPFGEEIPANTAGQNSQWGLTADVEQKFTGQIRDNETGMDYFNARYLTGALGKFNSSDPLNLGADATDPQTWNGYAYVRNNPLALVDPMGLCTFDAEDNAVEDENGACYEGGFGGSVTVTASAPPDVMPIFVSLPSLLSDTQQPMQSAPPPALTEASAAVRPFEPGNSRQGNKQMICLIEAAKDKGIPIALDVIGAIPAVGNAVAATGRIARAALALNHAITNPVVPIASGAYSGYEAITAKTQDPVDNFVEIASSSAGLGLTFADLALGGNKGDSYHGEFCLWIYTPVGWFWSL